MTITITDSELQALLHAIDFTIDNGGLPVSIFTDDADNIKVPIHYGTPEYQALYDKIEHTQKDDADEEYDEFLEREVLSQPDDFWDHIAMMRALMKVLESLLVEISTFEHIHDIDHTIEEWEELRLFHSVKEKLEWVTKHK